MDLYESTEQFTIERYEDMGVAMVRVFEASGMVRAQLTEDQFAEAFRPVQ